jgi:hypothetical protein
LVVSSRHVHHNKQVTTFEEVHSSTKKHMTSGLLLICLLAISVATARNDAMVEWDQRVCPLVALGLGPKFYQFWVYRSPSESEIRTAYHRQSLIYHPDKTKSPNAAEEFNLVNHAYMHLKGGGVDAQRRRLRASDKYRDYGLALVRVNNAVADLKVLLLSSYSTAMILLHHLRHNPVSFARSCWQPLRSITFKTVVIYTVLAWAILKVLESVYLWIRTLFLRLIRKRPFTAQENDARRRKAYEQLGMHAREPSTTIR